MPWTERNPYPGALYKHHWACFRCRKMFRKPSEFEFGEDQIRSMRAREMKCAECGQTLYNMGKAFRPPKQHQVKEWKALEAQRMAGRRWANGRW